jgi:hypothetical protein
MGKIEFCGCVKWWWLGWVEKINLCVNFYLFRLYDARAWRRRCFAWSKNVEDIDVKRPGWLSFPSPGKGWRSETLITFTANWFIDWTLTEWRPIAVAPPMRIERAHVRVSIPTLVALLSRSAAPGACFLMDANSPGANSKLSGNSGSPTSPRSVS